VSDRFAERSFGDTDEPGVISRVIPREALFDVGTRRLCGRRELILQPRASMELGTLDELGHTNAELVAELPDVK
jgi:hypothetical protein